MRKISSHRPSQHPRRRNLLTTLALSGLAGLLSLIAAGPAGASHNQTSILEPGGVGDPGALIQELHHLGVATVRWGVGWSDISPDAGSSKRPKFNASDPAAYPAGAWNTLDQVVRTAHADGMKVLFTLEGHAPKWAFGRGEPRDPGQLLGAWKPNAAEWGQFVHAAGLRYSGHYHGLPKVTGWEIYNEPNFGQSLSPQSVGNVLTSADMYRGLLGQAWKSLHATGHGHDTIIIGGLSAHGQNHGKVFGESKPLQFIRELYCVDQNYRPFRGGAARQRGCPSNAGSFRAQNPGLFNASGFSVHPYPLGKDQTVPPNRTRTPDKDYATFVQLPNVARALDRSVSAEGSRKHYAVWNTEYGYISNPPRSDGVSLANQAFYMNWAEYISWKNPRIGSFMQYLLVDPDPTHGVFACGGFSSGLIFNPALTTAPCAHGATGGAPKPALDAWRLALYMPRTSARKDRALEVWGCVRPAAYAFRDTHRAQIGRIQFEAKGSAVFADVGSVTLRGGSCYFDRRIKFPSSGLVRLAYAYPVSDTSLLPTFAAGYGDPLTPAVSRSQAITVR
jgi:hypothetical protein